jgi:hypothetical protein
VPFTFVNAGEYQDLRGKRQLPEHRAVEIRNVHGRPSQIFSRLFEAYRGQFPLLVDGSDEDAF